jgi:hypothetical protein
MSLNELIAQDISTLGDLEVRGSDSVTCVLTDGTEAYKRLNNFILMPFRTATVDKVAACLKDIKSSQSFLQRPNHGVPAITRALVEELPDEALRLCRIALEKDGDLERDGLDVDITSLGFSSDLKAEGQQTVSASCVSLCSSHRLMFSALTRFLLSTSPL